MVSTVLSWRDWLLSPIPVGGRAVTLLRRVHLTRLGVCAGLAGWGLLLIEALRLRMRLRDPVGLVRRVLMLWLRRVLTVLHRLWSFELTGVARRVRGLPVQVGVVGMLLMRRGDARWKTLRLLPASRGMPGIGQWTMMLWIGRILVLLGMMVEYLARLRGVDLTGLRTLGERRARWRRSPTTRRCSRRRARVLEQLAGLGTGMLRQSMFADSATLSVRVVRTG